MRERGRLVFLVEPDFYGFAICRSLQSLLMLHWRRRCMLFGLVLSDNVLENTLTLAASMSTSTQLLETYDNYYSDGKVSEKRTKTAVQTLNHVLTISDGKRFRRILDIGAGDGAVLAELAKRRLGEEYAAAEISGFGIEAIRNRKIEAISSIQSFAGYKIPHGDKTFDWRSRSMFLSTSSTSECFLKKLFVFAGRFM